MRAWKPATSRLRCMRTMRVLQQYLDGHLGEVPARRVARHLEDCRRCGLEEGIYREISSALHRRKGDVDGELLLRLRRFGEDLVLGNHRSA